MKLKLTIDGMHCNGCKMALGRALNDDENVINASVNLEEKIALVEVKEKTKVKKLKKIIKKAGFKCIKIEEV